MRAVSVPSNTKNVSVEFRMSRVREALEVMPKQDPHPWSGRDVLKNLLVGSMPSLLAKRLGKGEGGTEIFVPLKTVRDKASQPALGIHMCDVLSYLRVCIVVYACVVAYYVILICMLAVYNAQLRHCQSVVITCSHRCTRAR